MKWRLVAFFWYQPSAGGLIFSGAITHVPQRFGLETGHLLALGPIFISNMPQRVVTEVTRVTLAPRNFKINELRERPCLHLLGNKW